MRNEGKRKRREPETPAIDTVSSVAIAAELAGPDSRGLWSSLRDSYPPDVRRVVDAVAARGGLSLADLELIELAEHERLLRIVDEQREAELADGKSRAVAVSGLMSVRLQSRKHMRVIRQALSPISTPGDTRPMVPKAVADAYALTAADLSDGGDDLLS